MRLVICSKSPWAPSIRREHAVARSAAADGDEVVFVERPLDVRALGASSTRRAWWQGVRAQTRREAERIDVVAQATLVPGHHSDLAEHLDAWRLERTLRALPGVAESVLVATAPWQWPAVVAAPAARRVFDAADDWRALVPRRAPAISRLYARIAGEADAALVASAELHAALPGAAVVPNGVDLELAAVPAGAPAAPPCLVYAGTLSERFDAPLLGRVLDHLPEWEAELYGECQYAGRGGAPGRELEALLSAYAGRVRWRGAVERPRLAEALDRATVLVAPHRASLTAGQSSMKLYDYAARRRPIVATPGALGPRELTEPAGVREAAGAEEFAAAVLAADGGASQTWLDDHCWAGRWPRWRAAAYGEASA